jgi:hypothetical protein
MHELMINPVGRLRQSTASLNLPHKRTMHMQPAACGNRCSRLFWAGRAAVDQHCKCCSITNAALPITVRQALIQLMIIFCII